MASPGLSPKLGTRNSVQSPCQAPSSCQTRKVSATCPRTLWFWSTKTAQRSSGNRANLPPVALTRPSVPLSDDAHKVRLETTEVVLPSERRPPPSAGRSQGPARASRMAGWANGPGPRRRTRHAPSWRRALASPRQQTWCRSGRSSPAPGKSRRRMWLVRATTP